jgi:simple sugar transport system permease protein
MGVLGDIEFWAATLRVSTPLLLGAAGAVLCDRSGVMNIAIEGIMLTTALMASAAAAAYHNVWLGVTAAALVGAVSGLLLAYLTVGIKANQVVIGIGLNLVAVGLTSLLFPILCFDANNSIMSSPPFQRWAIPVLSDIPVVGRLLFDQQPLFYIAVVAVLFVYGFLTYTHPGLILKAVGENAKAANSVGINVTMVRYAALVAGSLLMGIAGSYLSLVEVTSFQPNLSGGRGFMALAAVIMGKWHPLGCAAAVLLFGFAEAFQWRLQGMGLPIPAQLPNMLPYVITVLVLAGVVGRANPPGDLGNPFHKEG